MTVKSRPLCAAQYMAAADTPLYTAGAGVTAIIDKVTAYNSDTGALLVAFNIVPNAGSVGASNKVVSKSLAPGETYTFPEVVGHVIESGGVLSGIAASATKVVVRISGREAT